MSSLEYGNDKGHGTSLSNKNHYSQFVHLPYGITKLSGQGGWTRDGEYPDDYKQQIENAFDNVENVLQEAGLSGWGDVSFCKSRIRIFLDVDEAEQVFLMRSYLTNMSDHFPYYVEVMKRKIPHRVVYTALSVPKLAGPKMIVEVEVEAWKK